MTSPTETGGGDEKDVPEALRRYLLEANFDAIEVARTTDAPHYRWEVLIDGKPKGIATTLTFDAHSFADVVRPERFTHIKLTHLNLDGLRTAFLFPETRIRFPESLPKTPTPLLRGIQIRGGDHSFFEDETIAFAENLTCLIGTRGAGKSTVVEALRYAFGYNRTLAKLDRLERPILDLQSANLRDTVIRVVYRTPGGEEHVLESTYDPKSVYATRVLNEAGDYLDVSDVEKSGQYPLRLFGWSEIETLGREAALQRDLLDLLIPEVRAAIEKRRHARERLVESHQRARRIVDALQSLFGESDGIARRFTEYKTDFDRLNTPEVQHLFDALDMERSKRGVLAQLSTNIESSAAQVEAMSKLDLGAGILRRLGEAPAGVAEWWHEEESKRIDLLGIEACVRSALNEASAQLRAFQGSLGARLADLDRRIQELLQGLRDVVSADTKLQQVTDLRANAESRLRRAEAVRTRYLQKFKELESVLEERRLISDEVLAAQNEIAGIRARYAKDVATRLNRFLPSDMAVTIEFRPGGDTQRFEDGVAPFLSAAPRYRARRLNSVIAKHSNPIEFARAIGNGTIEQYVGKELRIEESPQALTSGDVARIAEATSVVVHDEDAQVPVLCDGGKRLIALLQLQEVEWDDFEAILLNGKPVNEMSPGQRSSAMLPLIALAESTPLVIDQPEDNLDKRMIGRVLAKILAELKEKRQIVVCTHDPNILVGGDAEQVVVLVAESDKKGRVEAHGSIDNDDIVKTVVELLEGGKEAFQARRRRYGTHAAVADGRQ